MYVINHSRKWWHETCKIKCPDCETQMLEGAQYSIDIITQEHIFWKQSYACNYDMQYRATFNCRHCNCMFKAWSHIITNAGPPIGSGIIGSDVVIRNWNGFKEKK